MSLLGEEESVFSTRVTLGSSTAPGEASCLGVVDQDKIGLHFFVCAFIWVFFFFLIFLDVVLLCFLVVLSSIPFLRKNLKLVCRGENLEGLWGREDITKLYVNLKIVLNNEKYNDNK